MSNECPASLFISNIYNVSKYDLDTDNKIKWANFISGLPYSMPVKVSGSLHVTLATLNGNRGKIGAKEIPCVFNILP